MRNWFQTLLFQMQRVPLQRGALLPTPGAR
jgi:hypothetical protein